MSSPPRQGPSGNRSRKAGQPSGRPGSGKPRPDKARTDKARSDKPRSDRSRSRGDQQRPTRPEPRTAAERRAAEVRKTRGPRKLRTESRPTSAAEVWIDEGPVRSLAQKAVERGTQNPGRQQPTRQRKPAELAPDVVDELSRTVPSTRQARYRERLTSAAEALDRGRFDDAKRMVQPVIRDLPDMAFGHEIAGLALYRLGQWRKAIAELEVAAQLDGSLNHHAVLADCYRALHRYADVERLWRELREGSPDPALMAEGRMVAAGAFADRGMVNEALKVMGRAADVPKRVREYHLRQWYVIADLYDRSGDVIKARRFFGLVADHDASLADVVDRLKSLGA